MIVFSGDQASAISSELIDQFILGSGIQTAADFRRVIEFAEESETLGDFLENFDFFRPYLEKSRSGEVARELLTNPATAPYFGCSDAFGLAKNLSSKLENPFYLELCSVLLAKELQIPEASWTLFRDLNIPNRIADGLLTSAAEALTAFKAALSATQSTSKLKKSL